MARGRQGKAYRATVNRREARATALKVDLKMSDMRPTPLILADGSQQDAFFEVEDVDARLSGTNVKVKMWPPVQDEVEHLITVRGDLGHSTKGLSVEQEVISRVAALNSEHAAALEDMRTNAAAVGPAAGALATPQIIE